MKLSRVKRIIKMHFGWNNLKKILTKWVDCQSIGDKNEFMNSSSIPVSIMWSRMDQNIDSTVLSVNIEKVGIPELEGCTLNISPSNHNWESVSCPIFFWYFDFENITEFDWLIISIVLASIVCTMFTPCVCDFIIDIACWSWTTSWNLNNKFKVNSES